METASGSELVKATQLIALVPLFMSLSTSLYQLRNRRLQVFGVDWHTAALIRQVVTGITLWCAGIMVIQTFRSDVPVFFLTVFPTLALGLAVALIYDILSERPRFRSEKFWEITISPCLTALAPISQPTAKTALLLLA